ncbi:hypothetical protein FHY55_18065 [Oceanicola sp. D3]|uniref:hypothetical protein n=1 Tax=Oceanicola sp. D3 TaxID=2587163 RepID=UPI00111F9F31|nr:hypothetical protein [Oceanicola sp. D3]QDC11020.1 hypothetical protein FHY55_18065 [Oceanicola sp. D3]
MIARSERLLLLLAGAALLSGCAMGEPNADRPEPGVHFHGKVQMGVAKDADGNIRPVTRITG